MKELTIQLCNVTNKGYVVEREVTIDYTGVGEDMSSKKGGFDLFGATSDVKIKNDHVQNLVLYKQDKIIDLKQKIQLILGIPLYRQYLLPTPFEMYIYGQKRDNNIANLFSINTVINDIPVDMYCYNNNSNIIIKAFDYFLNVEDLLNIGANTEHVKGGVEEDINFKPDNGLDEDTDHKLYGGPDSGLDHGPDDGVGTYYIEDPAPEKTHVTDRRLIKGGSKGLVIKVVDINSIFHNLSNIEYKDHIYYGFILKYFPMITREVYDEFLDGKDLSNYDRLNPRNDTLFEIYSGEQSLNNRLSKIKPVKFSTYVRSAVAQVEGRTRIDLLRLFGELHLGEVSSKLVSGSSSSSSSILNLVLLSYRTRSGNILTKSNKKHAQNIRIKKNELIMLFIEDKTTFIMRLFPTGYYRIEAKWNNLELDFNKLIKIFQKSVNPLIQRLNEFGRPIFQDYFKLKEINKFNSSISSLLLDIYWRHGKYFSDIEDDLEEMVTTHVFTKTLEKDEDKKYKNKYMFNKGVKYDYFSLNEVGFNNDYSYATDIKAYQLWEKKLSGRTMLIINRLSDMKIEVDNIKQDEYDILIKYLTLFANKLEKKPKSIETPKIRLKKLKEYDPITFDLKQYDTNLLYSKICQQKFQPVIYSKDEVDSMTDKHKSKLVKYYNHTTEQPAWFECDNPNIPYLHFITGKHPKGYCLPCCKKTPHDRSKKSKEIYDACIEGRVVEYQEEKIQRYVMSYGKIMEPKRIGSLPIHFTKYFSMLYPGKHTDYYLYGVHQSNVQGYGTLPVISFLLSREVPDIINEIYNYVRDNHDVFLYAYGSNLSSYFNGVDSFLSDIIGFKNTLAESGGLENTQFNDWNRLFLELAEYVFGINFVLFKDLRAPGSNEDFDFEIELLKPYFNITGKFAIVFYYSVYSPIIETEPNKFFNKGVINSKLYDYDDPIIKAIESMLTVKHEISEVDINLVREVVDQKGYSIVHEYINARKLLYAVLVNTREGQVYFPVNLEPSNKLTSDVSIPDNLSYSALSSFVDDINVQIEQKYTNKYRKIEMNRLLVQAYDSSNDHIHRVSDNPSQGHVTPKVMGFYFGQNYYFDPITVDEVTMEATQVSYDPNHVNMSIVEYLKNPIFGDNTEYESLFEEVHKYDLFIMSFFDKIDKKTNKKVRGKVMDLLKNKYYKELNSLVGEDSQDIIRLYVDNSEDDFKSKFDTQRYEFDSKVLESYFEMDKDKLSHKLTKIMSSHSQKDNSQLIGMLADDLSNPAKRKHIQMLANLDYDLEVYPGESIFII